MWAWPLNWPLSRTKGATPARAAIAFLSILPSSGSSATSTAAVVLPIPGIEQSSPARCVISASAAMALTGFIVATIFWVVGAPSWLAQKLRPSPSTCAAAGWIVAWPAWLAFVVLRDTSPWLLLALAGLVWVADIAAYFAGKRFGRRKLAPAVSPGKTWEGVAGCMAGVAVYGIVLSIVAATWPTPISGLFEPAAGIATILAMLGLVAVSIVGDLFESWMKRGAGLKDSSRLLPGHGGILDRIDALTSTLPVAALALYLAR